MKSIFYSVLAYILIFCSVLILSNTNNSVKAENLICSAEITSTTQNVNFYGSDNETLLYTSQVPYGSTLNSVESKNLLPISPYYSVSFSGVQTTIEGNRLSYNGSATGSANVYGAPYVYLDKSLPIGNYTISLTYVDGSVVGSNQYRIGVRFLYDDDTFSNYELYDIKYGILTRSFEIVKPVKAFKIIGTFFVNEYYDITYDIMVNQGSSAIPFEPYYDDLNEYVNEQYLKSAGVSDMSTPVSWSTSKESNNKFPFNVPITQDLNLYGYINDGDVTDYIGNLTSRMSDIGNYAISDIVSLNLEGAFLTSVDYVFKPGDFNDFLVLEVPKNTITETISNVKSFLFNTNNDKFDFNMFVECSTSFSISRFPMSDNYDWLYIRPDNSTTNAILNVSYTNAVYYYDSNGDIQTTLNSPYYKETNYMFTEDTNQFVDMNSDTNYEIKFFNPYNDEFSPYLSHNSGTYLSYNLFFTYFYQNEIPFTSFTISSSNVNVSDSEFYYKTANNVVSDKLTCGFSQYSVTDFTKFQAQYFITDFYFIVDKPTFRVNNSLIIYNYDYYNTLFNVDELMYQLGKNGDYYNIKFTGEIPNYKYLYLDNELINNTIFDRYIFIHMHFTNTALNLLEADNFKAYPLGFDFNFVYYTEPLISDSSTFDYDFDKPTYKDTGDIFNINWLAVVYNIVVFIAFYMPLVSQVFEMLGLNYFFGGLLNVISFIFDNPLGNFLLGCLAFIIFFKLMLWFWPMAYQVGKNAYQSTSFYKSRQLEKDYQNYSANRRKNDYMKNRYDSENKKE